jgi:hypothetical protein
MNPVIQQLPTEAAIKKMVDDLITPELADAEAKALIEILMAVSDPESDAQWALAEAAARHAFCKTTAFERAFRKFAGFPETESYSANRHFQTVEQEQ